MRTAALGAIAMMCVGAALAQVPAGVDLATMQGWDIVLAEDAIPTEQYAAQEFQQLFAEASGVTLPIVMATDCTASDRPDRHVCPAAQRAARPAILSAEHHTTCTPIRNSSCVVCSASHRCVR
jgi:hypothetical protein